MTPPLIPLTDGARRVNRAPAILGGLFVFTLIFSLPLTLVLRQMIERHLGSSLAADTAATGVNYEWWQEFSAQATGVGVTFQPTIIGVGAVLDNLSAFIDNQPRPLVITAAAAAYMLLWLFFAGGIIDRFARQRPTRANGFFGSCGVFFFRFLRLAAVMGIVYGILFGVVHPWLFKTEYRRIIHDVTVERTAFLVRLGLYAAFGLVLAGCNLVFDYAKVRAVVEDRRSMVGAIAAAVRFAVRHAASVVPLYACNVMLFFLVVGLYGVLAPGAGTGRISTWAGFGLGQAYILARLWAKLVFWASETSLFQSQLAHAAYVATPTPTWPDSPQEEAVQQ